VFSARTEKHWNQSFHSIELTPTEAFTRILQVYPFSFVIKKPIPKIALLPQFSFVLLEKSVDHSRLKSFDPKRALSTFFSHALI